MAWLSTGSGRARRVPNDRALSRVEFDPVGWGRFGSGRVETGLGGVKSPVGLGPGSGTVSRCSNLIGQVRLPRPDPTRPVRNNVNPARLTRVRVRDFEA